MPGYDQTTARRLTRQHRDALDALADHPRGDHGQPHSTSIQDRILQWQAQGVAALPPDALSVVSVPRTNDQRSVAASRPTTPSEIFEIPPARTVRGRDSRRLADAEQQEWIRKGRASTPKKRVVSDEHWRKPHAKSVSPTRAGQSSPVAHDTPVARKEKTRENGEARAEREERRRRRMASRSKQSDVQLDSIRKATNNAEVHVDVQSNVGNRTGYDSERDDFSDDECDWGSLPGRDDDHILINSRYAATLGRPADNTPHKSSLRIKSKMLSRTKELLGVNEVAHTASGFVSSIEAWLDEQSDPFVDEQGSASSRTQIPERQDQKTKIKRAHRRNETFDRIEPNNMADCVLEGFGHDDNPSHDHDRPLDAVAGVAPTSPSSANLRRRGARSSRPRRHTLSQVPPPGDVVPQDTIPEGEFQTKHDTSPYVEQSTARTPTRSGETTPLLLTALAASPKSKSNEDGNGGCSLQRRLTTHQDLISELSKPGRSRRSRRRRVPAAGRSEQDKEAIERILSSIKEDEVRYVRELRTLVDGVIPVLLQCVLSKNDATAAAVLFTVASDASTNHDVSKPIIDMGVALERLKSLHNRFPSSDVDKMLSWCQTAHRAYSDYLKAWRLGFQDVVVNLAPLEDGSEDQADIMARDDNGDVVGADGEKVDVAYLLKRPLVKIRKMSKALNELAETLTDQTLARKIAEDYAELTAQAKIKHQQEQGRLEDDAAAQIDVTKTRDIRTLAALPGTAIEKGRRVRARDTFNLTLHHSTGQRMDCRVELVLRDNKDGSSAGGDLLVCQLDEGGKWLLFAPISLSTVSARREASGCHLVVMVRGHADLRTEWHELFALQTQETDAVTDWLNMLGSNPLPPKLRHVDHSIPEEPLPAQLVEQYGQSLTAEALARVSSLDGIDIPLGEPSMIGAQPPTVYAIEPKKTVDKPLPKLSFGGGLQPKSMPQRWLQHGLVPERKPVGSSVGAPKPPQHSPTSYSTVEPGHGQRAEEKSQLSLSSSTSKQPYSPQSSVIGVTTSSDLSSNVTGSSFIHSTSSATSAAPSQYSARRAKHLSLVPPPSRQVHQRRVSIATGKADVINPKTQASSARKSFSTTPLTETLREKWASVSGWGRRTVTATGVDVKPSTTSSDDLSIDPPQPPEHKVRDGLPAPDNPLLPELPALKGVDPEVLHPIITLPDRTMMQPRSAWIPSSPLKEEYAASTASGSPDEYDSESTDDSSASETSEDHGSEMKDDLGSLPDMKRRRPMSRPPPVWKTAPSTTGTHTLAPSDSASQGPYRSVPSSSAYPAARKEWCMALVCTWSDTGVWEPLRDEECTILVSPGLIEAFPASQVHAHGDSVSDPLVAFELTPIVPLRKGTALDITIRSPPTANSTVKTTNNVMFRSRSLMDCNKLYFMINWARCNNPTYMELERARPKPQPTVTFGTQQPDRPRSWFSLGGPRRRNSYRAGSVPPSTADSAKTAGSVSNAMSVLKRLSKTSAFSINRSSVVRRPGRGTNQSLYSVDSNPASGSGGSVPAPPTQVGFVPGRDGPNVPETSAEAVNGGGMVNNMKIKLFLRQGQDWKPLGPSRLSVLPAPVSGTPGGSRPDTPTGDVLETSTSSGALHRPASTPGTPRREYRLPSSSHTPHRIHGNGREKRILITQRDRADVVLLDEILGESCFEKVAERGIAVRVWTEDEVMRNSGGVLTGRGRLYMMQFSGQSEATWVFGLCGTYRYGTASNEG